MGTLEEAAAGCGNATATRGGAGGGCLGRDARRRASRVVGGGAWEGWGASASWAGVPAKPPFGWGPSARSCGGLGQSVKVAPPCYSDEVPSAAAEVGGRPPPPHTLRQERGVVGGAGGEAKGAATGWGSRPAPRHHPPPGHVDIQGARWTEETRRGDAHGVVCFFVLFSLAAVVLVRPPTTPSGGRLLSAGGAPPAGRLFTRRCR